MGVEVFNMLVNEGTELRHTVDDCGILSELFWDRLDPSFTPVGGTRPAVGLWLTRAGVGLRPTRG